MKTVSIRELMHHFSGYVKEIKNGDSFTILERNIPVADLIPHNKNIRFPGWKRDLKKRKIKGESFSTTTEKIRAVE